MEHLAYWIIFGAVVGFVYGWRKLARSTEHAKSIIAAEPVTDRRAQARALGNISGLRLSAAAIFAVVGAIAGAGIWAIAFVLAWMGS